MRWMLALCLVVPYLITLGLAPCFAATAAGASNRAEVERALAAATVVVSPECAGVLADGPDLVFTAAHCVQGRQSVELTFSDRTVGTGWVAVVDQVTDQALLMLEDPVDIAPLDLAQRRPIAGAVLFFLGPPGAGHFREIHIQSVARTASLPLLQNALHTTIVGTPGDAGAPIVDGAARVAGIVHGGAHLQVATPVTGLRRLVDKLLGESPLPPPAE